MLEHVKRGFETATRYFKRNTNSWIGLGALSAAVLVGGGNLNSVGATPHTSHDNPDDPYGDIRSALDLKNMPDGIAQNIHSLASQARADTTEPQNNTDEVFVDKQKLEEISLLPKDEKLTKAFIEAYGYDMKKETQSTTTGAIMDVIAAIANDSWYKSVGAEDDFTFPFMGTPSGEYDGPAASSLYDPKRETFYKRAANAKQRLLKLYDKDPEKAGEIQSKINRLYVQIQSERANPDPSAPNFVSENSEFFQDILSAPSDRLGIDKDHIIYGIFDPDSRIHQTVLDDEYYDWGENMLGETGMSEFIDVLKTKSPQEASSATIYEELSPNRARLYVTNILEPLANPYTDIQENDSLSQNEKDQLIKDRRDELIEEMTLVDLSRLLFVGAYKEKRVTLKKMPVLGTVPIQTADLEIPGIEQPQSPITIEKPDKVVVKEEVIGFGVKAETDVDANRTNPSIVEEDPDAGITFDPVEFWKTRAGLYAWGNLLSPDLDEYGMKKPGFSLSVEGGAGAGYVFREDRPFEAFFLKQSDPDFEPVDDSPSFTPVGEGDPDDGCCVGPEAKELFDPNGFQGVFGYGEFNTTAEYTFNRGWSVFGNAGYLVEAPIPAPGPEDRGMQFAYPGGANHQITFGGGLEKQLSPGFTVRAEYEQERDNIGYPDNTINIKLPLNDQIGENRPIPYLPDGIHHHVNAEIEAGRFTVTGGAEIIRDEVYPKAGVKVRLFGFKGGKKEVISQNTLSIPDRSATQSKVEGQSTDQQKSVALYGAKPASKKPETAKLSNRNRGDRQAAAERNVQHFFETRCKPSPQSTEQLPFNEDEFIEYIKGNQNLNLDEAGRNELDDCVKKIEDIAPASYDLLKNVSAGDENGQGLSSQANESFEPGDSEFGHTEFDIDRDTKTAGIDLGDGVVAHIDTDSLLNPGENGNPDTDFLIEENGTYTSYDSVLDLFNRNRKMFDRLHVEMGKQVSAQRLAA